MGVIGVDFGLKKVGVAFADGGLAEPLEVIRYKDESVLIDEIGEVIKDKQVEKVIVGVSRGKMGQMSREFGRRLGKNLGIEVEYWDEAFSSKDAQMRAIEGGMKRKKRKQMEDAYAAAVILQGYLDSKL